MTLLIVIKYHEQAAALAAQQARLALEDTGPELTHYATAGELRGIPAIGRTVTGAIPYTDPYRETERRDLQAQRLRERTAA